MNRRDIAIAAAGSYALLNVQHHANAQARPPEDGVDFISLEKPARTEAPAGKIEVAEFFWYNCQHCNRFEPDLEKWVAKLPKDVHFRRVPVAFRDDFVPQQKLFYTLEAMKLVERLHKAVFAAIHVQKTPLANSEQITKWISGLGVNAAEFTKHYESFTVNQKAMRATQLQLEFQVAGVPSLGVAGRYYTDGAIAQSMERALQVVDDLVARERNKPKPAKK